MPLEQLFSLSNLTVMPFWLLMILVPGWSWTRRIISSPWIAILPAAIYAVLVLPQLGSLFAAVSNPNLAAIAQLLATPAGATIAWAHFLAFDVLIGRWIYLDSRERGIHGLISAPILFLTLMLGPLGYISHLIIRLLIKQVPNNRTNAAV